MRPGVQRRVLAGRHHRGQGSKAQRRHAEVQHGERSELHLAALDLLAQVLGGAAHHEAGDEHGEDGVHEQAHDADPDAAEHHLAQGDVEHRHHAGEGRETVVSGIDGATGRVGGRRRPEDRVGDPEPDLLALHVAAGLRRGELLVGAQLGEDRVALLLACVHHGDADEQDRHGRREERPPLSLVAGESPERVGESDRDRQERQILDEVGERRGVLVGMRRVGIVGAAAVGAELLDDLLRGEGPLRDGLHGALDRHRVGRPVQVLHHALRDQEQPADDRDGQQHVQEAARRIDPEVAELAAGVPGDAADEGHRDRHADGGRDEVLASQGQHLREVAHRRLGNVDLPVGIGGEADGRVEGHRRAHVGDVGRVEGQMTLQAQDHVDEQEHGEVEDKQRDRVGGDPHLPRLVDAAEAVGQLLDRPHDAVHEGVLAAVDVGHVGAERLGDQRQQHDVEHDLRDTPPHGSPNPRSESLWTQERVEQVDDEGGGDDPQHEVIDIHDWLSLEPGRDTCIADRQREKGRNDQQIDEITHVPALPCGSPWRQNAARPPRPVDRAATHLTHKLVQPSVRGGGTITAPRTRATYPMPANDPVKNHTSVVKIAYSPLSR